MIKDLKKIRELIQSVINTSVEGQEDWQRIIDASDLPIITSYIDGLIDAYGEDDEDDTDEHDSLKECIDSMLDRLNEEQEESEVTIERISETHIDEIIEKLEMAKRGEVEITKLSFEGRLIHE